MARPTMATMKALREEKEALAKELTEARAEIDARDEKIEALEDERDAARRNAERLQAALDALAEDEMRARLRFDAAIYAMVLMQRETLMLREAIAQRSTRAALGYAAGPAQSANKGEWRWDGKDSWERTGEAR